MNKTNFASILVIGIGLLLASCSSSNRSAGPTEIPDRPIRLEYTSSQLVMKNSDQIRAMVKRKIDQALEPASTENSLEEEAAAPDVEDSPVGERDAVEYFKDGLRITCSRPDQEGTRGPLFLALRKELNNYNAFEEALRELTEESLSALRKDNVREEIRATYVVFLENLMAEIRPEVKTNPQLEAIVVLIRDANIRIPESLRKQQLLRTMRPPRSPSEIAAQILKGS